MLFSYGKLYSYFPMKWVYTSALTIFLAGGIVCATAQSSNALIIGRAIAGLGCAGMLSGGSM
jgi:MFS family permease